MRKVKALRDYVRFSDAELLKKAHAVSSGLKGNASYPNPNPSLKILDVANQNFEDALANAKSRDQVKAEEKNVIRRLLIGHLDNLRDYVNATTPGDRAKLLSTGFTVGIETGSLKAVGDVTNFKAVPGKNSGEVVAGVRKVYGAKSYRFDYGETPVKDDNWKTVVSTTCKHKLTGLPRGKEFDFRIGAVGNKGEVVYSGVLSVVVN